MVTKSGQERFHNQVQWARQYLAWEGFIDSSKRGVWSLTPIGRLKTLDYFESRAVPPKEVRDLRGAMDGRAEKGILLTTGTFSAQARIEAERPGATPIELVDGEKLYEMFKRFELGLKPTTVYEIDLTFFDIFK